MSTGQSSLGVPALVPLDQAEQARVARRNAGRPSGRTWYLSNGRAGTVANAWSQLESNADHVDRVKKWTPWDTAGLERAEAQVVKAGVQLEEAQRRELAGVDAGLEPDHTLF